MKGWHEGLARRHGWQTERVAPSVTKQFVQRRLLD